MRHLLILVALASLLGCDRREEAGIVQDRKGRARSPEASNSVGCKTALTGEGYHTVGLTDSLSSIAAAYGTTVERLVRRNYPGPIKLGDCLIIPKATTAP